ncbi:hypothetical protein M4D79_26025 [Mycolicibacterium novocastrense]|nr:hypothetical protein M4D79_26025 [Mycolicibacterium novocastrense]
MFDGLEAADGTAELNAFLRVTHGHVEAPLRRAELFGGQRDDRDSVCALEGARGGAVGPDEPRGDGSEVQFRDLRVRSSIANGSRLRPSASPSTANSDVPAAVFAATRTVLAV